MGKIIRNGVSYAGAGAIDASQYLCQCASREKNLGDAYTAAQKAAIAAGDFSDLWNGDYWEDAGGRKWRIVDNTEPFMETGPDAAKRFKKHGVIVMPDDNLIKGSASGGKMMDTNSTSGGYIGTKYRSTYRSQCRALFDAFFGSAYIGEHYEFMSNASASGKASSIDWDGTLADVELPSEINIYGSAVWSMGGSDSTGFNVGLNKTQFKLFSIKPEFIIDLVDDPDYAHYWLRDVVSAPYFAYVNRNGNANPHAASRPHIGFRPYAIITGV